MYLGTRGLGGPREFGVAQFADVGCDYNISKTFLRAVFCQKRPQAENSRFWRFLSAWCVYLSTRGLGGPREFGVAQFADVGCDYNISKTFLRAVFPPEAPASRKITILVISEFMVHLSWYSRP